MPEETIPVLHLPQDIADQISKIGTDQQVHLSAGTVAFLIDGLEQLRGKDVVIKVHPPFEGELRIAMEELRNSMGEVAEGQEAFREFDDAKLEELKQKHPSLFEPDPSKRDFPSAEAIRDIVKSFKSKEED